MLNREDVAIILESLSYYSNEVVVGRDKKRVWKVFFKIKEAYVPAEGKRVDETRRKLKIVLGIVCVILGLVTGYVLDRLF